MANITVRNIPDDVLARIKALSAAERRSLNNEILIILERGASSELDQRLKARSPLSRSAQIGIWKRLLGAWEDNRSTRQIVDDIYSTRTAGRDVNL